MASPATHAGESFSSPNWGNHFVAVESVQELALQKPNEIPERYIRSEDERPSSTSFPSLLTVPVIDMEKLLLPSDNQERQKEMGILSKACVEWGFFQVVNHGIPHALIDRIRGVANEFFSLSLEEKQRYAPHAGDAQGYGNMFVVDEDQKLDWGDLMALALMPIKLVNLALWSTTPSDYRIEMASSAIHAAESFSNPFQNNFVPVESVQELTLKKPNGVPQRYIRSENERPSSTLLPSLLTVPVIDMEKLLPPSDNHERQKEMGVLSKACVEWGFFQIVNHGVPHSLIDRMRGVVSEFFSLPLDEKQSYAKPGGDVQGYGNLFVVDEDQKLDWGDLMTLAVMSKMLMNLSLWPTTPSDFRNTVERYTAEVERVAQDILGLFAENLLLKSDYFKEEFGEDPLMTMRMNLYPPCSRSDLVLGLSPHSDGDAITLLLQDDQIEGLHVRKNNEWIPIQPIPYAFVVNIGDLMEVMTNGRYKSIEHRAVTNKENARLSIAMFYHPGLDEEVDPASNLVDEEHPALYKKFKHQDYIRYYMAKRLNGKKSLADFAKVCE